MALNEKDSLLGPSYSPCVSAGLNDRGDDPRFLHTTALESYDGDDSSPGGGCATGDEFNPELGKAELALFFVLGLAPVFVWNCVFVSVAYFQTVLGKAVLSRLGLCQNGASLAVQLLLLLLRKQVRVFAAPVSGCFIYMAVMSVVLLALPLDTLHPWMLYIGLTLNGMATGIAQTQLGCVAGLYGKAGRCGALLFSGNALGALLPPLLQLCMAVGIQAAGGGSGPDALRHEAIAIFAIGASGALFGLFCIIALSRTRNYRTLTAPTSMNSNCDCATIGSRVDLARRPAAEWTVKVSQLLLVITRATWLFALAIAPYVTPHDTTSPFWMRYLATVLIGATNVGDLIGRLAATASPPAYILQSLPLLIGGSAVRAVVTTTIVACYVALPSDFAAAAIGTGNGFIILVYVLMSLTHGYLVVALQTKSQALCGFLPGVDSCPVVAQISWLSSQIGLVVGIGASFIPLGQS